MPPSDCKNPSANDAEHVTAAKPAWRFPKAFVATISLLLASSSFASDETIPIATLDWTIAETLIALKAPPQAVGQVEDYHAWVGEPRLPDDVTDLGLRSQPNMERLAAMEPERILISPMFGSLAPQLARIGPVDSFELYTPGQDTWERMLELTRELGRLASREAAAESLIEDTEAYLSAQRETLPETRFPLLMVQFMDARHVRVFGGNSLYQAVLDRLGLENAWTRDTNYWGFTLVGIEELIGVEAHLVIVEPYPMGVKEQLATSGLWHRLHGVEQDAVSTLPAVWSFGALPSARRFAEELLNALTAQGPA